MLFRTRHALVTVLALAGLASCATAKRAACTVPSDCSDGEYCGAPHNGSRTCTFDCRVASDCTGGGPCLPNGQCQEQVMVDDGGMIVDAAPSSDGQVVILPDGSVTPDSSLPIDAAPPIDSAVFMDAAPGACGLVPPQTGCPGQACDLNGATPQCRANGTQAHDALCGINQNCVAGSICLSDGF